MHVLTLQTALLLALLGAGVGAFGTLVGVGGGFILTPLLLILYPNEAPETLAAIGLVAVFANAGSGSLAYWRQRRIDLPTGLLFAAAALPGAVLGALATGLLPRRAFDLLMAALLAVLAAWLAVPRRPGRRPPAGRLTRRHLVDRAGHEFDYRVPLVRGAGYSVGVGFASSLLGIGGGVIHVPLLVRALGVPTHVATATSHFVLAIMAGTASVTHVLAGSFGGGHGVYRALVLAVSLALGAQAGARLSGRVSARLIERMLTVALVLLAVRLGWTAVGPA